MQSFEKQTNLLAWHGNVILLPKQCQHTWESAPFKMQSFKTHITLRAIALENCFENSVHKSPAWHRNWKLLRKQCQHTWACTVVQSFEKQTNHLAWHGYVELLRKQDAIVQNTNLITLHGIAIENCFENSVKTTPGMASQLNIASKTMSTHMSLHCLWCNHSKNKSPGMAWICRIASKTMSTHEYLHHSRCNRSKDKQITLYGIAIENCLENSVKKTPGMASQLNIASKTVSTHMNLHCSWCNHSKNKQIIPA